MKSLLFVSFFIIFSSSKSFGQYININTTCPGDTIIGESFLSNLDSLNWVINDSLVSSGSSFSYPTTLDTYLTYNIYFFGYLNDTVYEDSAQITHTPPEALATFQYSTDTLACYGLPHHIQIDPNLLGQSQTYLDFYWGEDYINGTTLSGSLINYYLISPTETDTLWLITRSTNHCVLDRDTVAIPITVEQNLVDFDFIQFDTTACVWHSQTASFVNGNSQYNYNFSIEGEDYLYTTGSPDDTLNLYFKTWLTLDTVAVKPRVLTTTSSFQGCTNTRRDTIFFHNPSARFELLSRSYPPNDTVNLVNMVQSANPHWSSDNIPLIQNENEFHPLISIDTEGIYDLDFSVAPMPNCTDSRSKKIHIAEYSPDPTYSECNQAVLDFHTEFMEADKDGFIYSIGSFSNSQLYPNERRYWIKKMDPNGSVIWEKLGSDDSYGYGNFCGARISGIDFDGNGNPIISLWVENAYDYFDDYLEIDGNSDKISRCFIIKIDKYTGDKIWCTALLPHSIVPTSYPLYNTNWRVTDVAVRGNRIYTTTYRQGYFEFFTLNLDGTLIHKESFNFGSWTQNTFIPFSSTAGINCESTYESPKLEVLPSGELVALFNFKKVYYTGQPAFNISNSENGIALIKYSPESGIQDPVILAKTGLGNHNDNAFFTVDGNTITFAGYFHNHREILFVGDSSTSTYTQPYQSIQILDSIPPYKYGTFICNFSTDDYQINWLTLGTQSEIEDFKFSKKSKEYYLASFAKSNISFANIDNHMMQGRIHDTLLLHLSDRPYHSTYLSTAFISKFDSVGKPISIKKFEGDQGNFGSYGDFNLDLAVFPCSDYILNVKNLYSSFFDDNQTYSVDSSYFKRFSDDCNNLQSCSFYEFPDTVFICENLNDTVEINAIDYFGENTLNYSLYDNQNNNISSAVNVDVIDGRLQLTNTVSSDTTTLVLQSIEMGIDTVKIINHTTPENHTSYLDTICETDTLNFASNLSSEYEVVWDNSTSGSSYSINDLSNHIGSNFLPIWTNWNNECINLDTLTYFVDPIPDSNTFVLNDSICSGEEIFISGENQDLSYSWFYLNETSANVQLSPGEYITGTNIQLVEVSNTTCSYFDTVSFTVLSCASIEDLGMVKFAIFPNPSKSGYFFLKSNNYDGVVNLEVLDLLGRKVVKSNTQLTNGQEKLILKGLSKGTYQIKVNEIYTFKIIVQ